MKLSLHICKFSIHSSGTTISLINLSQQVPRLLPKFTYKFLLKCFFKNYSDVLDPLSAPSTTDYDILSRGVGSVMKNEYSIAIF